jgi:hypothetical protein
VQDNTNNDSLFNVSKCMNMDIVLTKACALPFLQTCHLIHHIDSKFVKLDKKSVLHYKPPLGLCRMIQYLWGINLLHDQPLNHQWFSMIGLDCTSWTIWMTFSYIKSHFWKSNHNFLCDFNHLQSQLCEC